MTNYTLACAYEEMNPSRRNTMEDVHRIVPNLGGSAFSYFGVYDGHGGRQIADFLEASLENTIHQELVMDDDASIPDKLARAFLITDMESKKSGITTSGATCVSALLHTDEEGHKQLHIANVGDSRAVLCSRWDVQTGHRSTTACGYSARRLSHDHTADDPSEASRIQAAGGFVTRGRVLGILAVARSFGDHGMKDFVSAQPHLCTVNLTSQQQQQGEQEKKVEKEQQGGHQHPFLILACDGVWDVMTDQEAVEMVLEHCHESSSSSSSGGDDEEEQSGVRAVTPSQGAAELLVDEAIERGTSDNVTAIVVFF